MEYVDFVRFSDKLEWCGWRKWGYDAYITFYESEPESTNVNSADSVKIIRGFLVKAESVPELLSGLKKAEGVVGVLSSEIKVNREAVMRKKVDIILDSAERRLDYTTVKLAAEKDVIIEVSFSKFINSKGIRRMRLFEETVQLLRIIDKFDAPFALTTAAHSPHELRQRRQVEDFFAFLGASVEKARMHAWKLLRRLTDERYIMDGVEVEE